MGQSVVLVVGMLFCVLPDCWLSGYWVVGTGVCCVNLGLGGGTTFGGVLVKGVWQGVGMIVSTFDLCAKCGGGGTHLATVGGGSVVGGGA